MNCTLCDMARYFDIETGTTWDEHVGAVLFAYRCAMHSSAQASPANLLFGKELRTPLDSELDLYLDRNAWLLNRVISSSSTLRLWLAARYTPRLAMEKAALLAIG